MATPGPSAVDKLHRKLLFSTIAIEYLHESVDNGLQKEKFLAASKTYFQTEIEDSLDDVGEILRHFERTGHISVGKYGVLKDIVQFNKKIVEEIKKTEIAMIKLGGSVIRDVDDGCDEYLIADVKNSTVRGEEWHAASHDMKKIHMHLQDHNIKLVAQNSDDCEWFSSNLQTHHDLMKESNNILRLLEADDIDTRIQSFVELARKSKDLLVSRDEAFHKFAIRWRNLNRSLVEDCRLITVLQGKGGDFQGLLQGSLFIFLRFENVEMLDSFWNEYTDGSLHNEVQNAVCTDIRSGEEKLLCQMTLSEENYRRYRRYLEKSSEKKSSSAWQKYNIFDEEKSVTKEETDQVSLNLNAEESTVLPQTFISCGKCGQSVELPWFCKNCPSSLCDICADEHKTIAESKGHVVVRRTYNVQRLYGPAKLAEQCHIHQEKEISSYCNDCKVPCCINCIIEEHSSHEKTTIEEKYLSAEIRLNRYTRDLDTGTKPTLDKMQKQERSDVAKNNENKIEVINDINGFRKEVIKDFNQACDNLVNQVEKISDKNNIGLGEIEKKIEKLESVRREVVDKIQKGKLDLIEYNPPELHSFIPKTFLKKFLPSFVPVRKILHTIRDRVGTIELKGMTKRESEGKCKMTPEVLKSFKCKIRTISIVKATENLVWVMGCQSSTMYMYDKDGHVIRSVTVKESSDIYDMVLTRSQDMIITSEHKKIRFITVNGEVSTLVDTTPFMCYGVCLTHKNEIVVCLSGQAERNHIAVYSPDGLSKIREIRGVDRHGRNLITDPYRVIENHHDLCVVNWGSNVICVNEEGDVMWLYDGKVANLDKAFNPRCISVDKYLNMLITDIRNNCVHYIDREGELIQIILTQEETGLHGYWGVCVDDEKGQVWLGNAMREIIIAKYLE